MSVTDQVRKQANLRLLQRTCCGEINDIVRTATHVVLYEYVGDAWKKSNVEGSLFLTQTSETYKLVVINRNSNENFVMEVTSAMQMQHQDPYLIFKDQGSDNATRIRGIWFHSAEERMSMATVIQQSIQQLQHVGYPPPPSTPQPAAVPPPTPTTTAPAVPSTPASYAAAAAASAPASTPDGNALSSLLSSMAVSAAASTPQAAAPAAAATATPPRSASSGGSGAGGSSGPIAMDKKSLQLALLSLIQDDRFLDLLHSQYLRVVHARAKKGQPHQQQPPP